MKASVVFLMMFILGYPGCSGIKDHNINDCPKIKNPDDFAEEVFDVCNKSMTRLYLLVGGMPDINDSIRYEVKLIRDQAIEELVYLGKAREKMNKPAREGCSEKLKQKLPMIRRSASAGLLDVAVPHYRAIDRSFANELDAFSRLAIYAQFELLREQLPEEAKRLGISKPD